MDKFVRLRTSRYSKYAEISFVDIMEGDSLTSSLYITEGRVINTQKFLGRDSGPFVITTIRTPKREVSALIEQINKFNTEVEQNGYSNITVWQDRLLYMYKGLL